MEMTLELLLSLIAIPLVWSLININHWYYLRQVLRKHDKYLAGAVKNASKELKESSLKAAEWITANQTEIKRRIDKAGVNAPRKTIMEPAGLGFAGQQTINALDNLLFLNAELLQQARRTIEVAKGYYLAHAKLSLSPLHWIEVLLFLPRELITASGIEVTSKAVELVLKMVQIAYWVILAALALFGLKS